MKLRIHKILCLLLLYILTEFNIGRIERFSMSRAFFVYKSSSIDGRACTCSTIFSCSCCENVIILYGKRSKKLCINFMYQNNSLNVNISLNSDVLRNLIVTEYKPFKICTSVPGCFFSTVCANILELNRFPRSITACLRTEIATKYRLWQLTYNCVSISTELSVIANSTTTTTAAATTTSITASTIMMTSSHTSGTTTVTSGKTQATTKMPLGQISEMTVSTGQMIVTPVI